MNFVIELLDNNSYELNEDYKHTALFVYNNILLLSYFEKIIMSVQNEQDKIIYLVSNKNNTLINNKNKRNIEVYSYDEFENNITSYDNDEFVVINTSYYINKGMMDVLINQIHNSKKIYIQLKDELNNIGLSYIKSLKNINKNKYKDFFLSKEIVDINIENKQIVQTEILEDLAKRETICSLYETVQYPLDYNLVDLFRKVVDNYPNDIAIQYKNIKLTYKELDDITDKIANSIICKTTVKSNNIGILLEHDWKYVVSMISIIKAGKTYVPMSKLYPVERLQLIINIANLDGIVVDSIDEINSFELQNNFLVFDNLISEYDDKTKVELPKNSNDSIAYIMFTSGSTGTPKGVKITHRNIINNAYFLYNKVFSGKSMEPSHYGVLAEFVFDMSVQQIYPALLFGKTLHIYPGDNAKTPQNMMNFFEEVDTCDATPIALRLVTDYINSQFRKNNPKKIKYIHLVVGGEKLSYNLCKEYFDFCQNNEITNIYGPTECTVEVSTYYLNKQIISKLKEEVPIGYTVDNSRIYVLNDNNKMLPPNSVGEICVCGECVGNGYINSNSKSFCKDILTDDTMYKTGDLGYYDVNGLLYYVGRNDRQVKVNGYRVDLGDIEKNLETTKYISESRVLYKKINGEEKKIVAYIIGTNSTINLNELLSDIRGKLPNYMIPSYFIQVKEFITNINGKLDFSKLPDISTALRINENKILQFDENDKVSKEILEYLENEFSCNIIGKSDCDLQSLGCDSLGVFNFLAFIEDKYGISINDKIKLYTSPISAVIDNIKSSIIKNQDKTQDEYVYKKKYLALSMQNYLYNQECDVMLNGDSSNFNAMVYLYELVDNVDEKLLEEAITEVIKQHDAFNMSFKCNGSICKILYNKESQYSIEHMVYHGNIRDINKLIPEIRYFDNVLAYFYIVRTNDKKYLLTGIHHLIYDYMSAVFLIRDIESYYFNKESKKSSFFRIIEKKNKKRISNEYIKGLQYWEQYAKNVCIVDNLYIPSTLDYEKEVILYNIKGKELDKCSKISGVSKFILCLGIFYSSIFAITDQKKVTIGTFLNGRDHIFPTSAIGFLSKYIPFTFENKGELTEKTLVDLQDTWNQIKRYEESADIGIILNNMVQSCNVMFDYQVMYNNESVNNIYNKIYTYENIQEGFALTYKLYEYKDKLALEICYSKNNSKEIVNKVRYNFEKNLKEIIKKYLNYEREEIICQRKY